MKLVSISNILVLLTNIKSSDPSLSFPNNPYRLIDLSLKRIKENLPDDAAGILIRLYPKLFNSNLSLTDTGIFHLATDFPFSTVGYEASKSSSLIEVVDLSDLNIERIPIEFCRKMMKIKVLNLSTNPMIKLDEEWIEYFYENLEELNLNYCNLNSSVFNTLKNFKKLQKLSISESRSLDTTSEKFIKTLEKLKHLDVSDCSLYTEDFMNILGNANHLESLNFSGNFLAHINYSEIRSQAISSTISLNESFGSVKPSCSRNSFSYKLTEASFDLNIRRIKVLNLKECSIVDENFIKMLFELPQLETLILSKNNINFDFSTIPSSITIRRLELEKCGIDNIESLNFFTSFKNLEILNVSFNNFKKKGNSKFNLGCSKDSLLELDISNCQINTEGLRKLTNCSKLQVLNAACNSFEMLHSNFDFDNLKNTLSDLNVSYCKLRIDSLKALTKLIKLQKLNFSSNSLKNFPESFDFGTLKETLVELDISDCCLSVNGFILFTDFPNLQVLIASSNFWNDADQDVDLSLGSSINSLIKLTMRSCGLYEADLLAINECLKLQELDIQGNDFEFLDGNFDLWNLKESLVTLNISDCVLNSVGLSAFTKFSKLQTLNASSNRLNIPENFDFENLNKTLKNLKLSGCNLGVNSLKSLTNFCTLENLNLYGNNLRNLPENFDLNNLKNTLKDLNVSNCKLNYNSLKMASKCLKLQKLDISGNNLQNNQDNCDFINPKNSLISLNVSKCKLKTKDLRKFTLFSKLQYLDFSYNSLKKIRKNFEFRNLNHTLLYLNLKNCSIRNISALNGLKLFLKLQVLDLRNNHFKIGLIRKFSKKHHKIIPFVLFAKKRKINI